MFLLCFKIWWWRPSLQLLIISPCLQNKMIFQALMLITCKNTWKLLCCNVYIFICLQRIEQNSIIPSLVTLLSIVQWNCIKNIYTDWLKNRRELNVTLLRCWQKCKTSLSSDQFFSQLFLAANLWMANLRLDKLWIEINLRNYSRTVLEVWTCSGALLLL